MDLRRLCTAVAVAAFIAVPYAAFAKVPRVERRSAHAAVV